MEWIETRKHSGSISVLRYLDNFFQCYQKLSTLHIFHIHNSFHLGFFCRGTYRRVFVLEERWKLHSVKFKVQPQLTEIKEDITKISIVETEKVHCALKLNSPLLYFTFHNSFETFNGSEVLGLQTGRFSTQSCAVGICAECGLTSSYWNKPSWKRLCLLGSIRYSRICISPSQLMESSQICKIPMIPCALTNPFELFADNYPDGLYPGEMQQPWFPKINCDSPDHRTLCLFASILNELRPEWAAASPDPVYIVSSLHEWICLSVKVKPPSTTPQQWVPQCGDSDSGSWPF